MENLRILIGDCRDKLKTLPDESFHSCVTDPPYELGFMGKAWDKSGVAYDVNTWREVLRVLKPGAHLLAFGGTRTYHRMACAIEDAGFEIRDQIGWAYGSGFPKSLDVSKAIDKAAGARREVVAERKPVKRMIPGADQNETGSWIKDNGREFTPTVTAPATEAAKQWDGWGTALKPAWEPICVARKPLVGTVADNVQKHGTGAINIDGCRVQIDPVTDASQLRTMNRGLRESGDGWGMSTVTGDGPQVVRPEGRWPANLIHDGSEEVIALFPSEAGAQAPVTVRNGDKFRNAFGAFKGDIDEQGSTFQGDSGSAARFFYCAKVSPSERGDCKHPTMKPVALMRYLCRLVTPKGGAIVDPFGGSGSTAVAALEEGFSITVCELVPEHAEYIQKRTDITPGFAL